MATFQFATKNHNMIEFDYCGEGVFNVKTNGEEKEGTHIQEAVGFSSNFIKKRPWCIYLM
jgi:hypothetical protein